jgi:carbonic anhydrase/acetyltransferase-like protein (isoleucine patch superfamily)
MARERRGEVATRAVAALSAASAPIAALFMLPYDGVSPLFATPPSYVGPQAAVLGRATLGRNARLGASCLIRADGHFVRIGDDFSLGDRGTVHIDHDVYPAIVGDRVTVGTNAVVHACTLGSDIVVEDNSVVLDGSSVEDNVVLDANSIVFPRSRLEGGKLYSGMPARPVRDLRPGEVAERAALLRQRLGTLPSATRALADGAIDPSVFVAGTARLRGRIVAAPNSSIWFGNEFDANGGEIAIGQNTNIQDNTVIRCRPGRRFEIGADATVGHNVTFGDCLIGDRTLIGISSVVADGTVIEDDVFLAAGGETQPGQVLERGWLYGRRPAEKLAPLDQAKRDLIAVTIRHYCNYARIFAEAQREAAKPR